LAKPDEARTVLDEALKGLHDHAKGLAALAVEVGGEEPDAGYAEIALRAAARALELDASNADALMARFYVLVSTKRTDEAIASAEDAINRMKGHAEALAAFARLLSSPEHAKRCDKLALQAVDLAIAADPAAASHLVTKFDIQAICNNDVEGANATGRYLIEKAGDDANLLNSFAWGLLDDEQKKGKFDKLALDVAMKANALTDGENWSILDTLALAKFAGGQRDEAIKLQKKALALCENPMFRFELQGRLDQFEKAAP
jgi:tetratricopeptide (TPR) repeat protein